MGTHDEKDSKVKAGSVTADDQAKPAELEAKVAEMEAALSAANEKLAIVDDKLAAADEQLSLVTGERDTWQSKATALFDQYTRAKADFDGFRKRTERDFEDRLTRGKADYLRSVLDVLDNFDRFLAASAKSGQDSGERSFDAFYRGVSMVHKQLMDTLAREGVEPIKSPVGKQMDPAFHEAVAAQEDGGEHGTVIEELQKGYIYKGLVLRPSKVKVAR